jgi:hypothetical protein
MDVPAGVLVMQGSRWMTRSILPLISGAGSAVTVVTTVTGPKTELFRCDGTFCDGQIALRSLNCLQTGAVWRV